MFVRGSQVGSERVVLSRSGTGWRISATGNLAAPFDLVTTKFEMNYAADWQPLQLEIEGRLHGQAIGLTTSFGVTTATNEAVQNGQRSANSHQVSPRAVVLPNSFFGSYEALAMRLATAAPGTRLPVYVAPDAEVSAVVDRVTPRRMAMPEGTLEFREFAMTMTGPSGPMPVEVWTDSRQRLARISLPAASVVVVRNDLTSVMAREEPVSNRGDEGVFIAANGFSLADTITKPAGAEVRPAAVVFVSSPGPQGRDHVTYGVPIFGLLAGSMAEAGYFVVRYDPRGTGQSGGRTESAGLTEYADDALAVVQWLRKRKDVDANRIAFVGYSDGGPIALLAASREKRVKGVALLAAAGRSGRDVTVEQQDSLLARLPISEAERAARRSLQNRISDATITGRGWETLPASLRREVDTPWYRSWLLFDPAETIKKLEQPLLIVHGALDKEMPPEHANRLEALSQSLRKRPATFTQKAVVPGINHLLVAAASGDVDEYPTLPVKTIAAPVTNAILTWLPIVSAPR